tara:strand:+ start:2039 stop:3298 length:1260 start_codon:yes stop_codon:yes gene_type:complete
LHPNISELVKLITSEIRSNTDKKEKWAQFKRNHVDDLTRLLQLEGKGMDNPGALVGIDFDEDRKLMLLNYTGQAHNFLHEIKGGWTHVLRQMRGMIVSYDGEPTMVSRGFEKFFNYNELYECSVEGLGEKFGADTKFLAREKADGHMIEYFVHDGELCASTRGKFGTTSSELATGMFELATFKEIEEGVPNGLTSVVVELVHPDTRVHVDYDKSHLFLLAAFDSAGNRYSNHILGTLSEHFSCFTLPTQRLMSLNDMISEINDRSVLNNEGWVMDFDGYLVKFKYISYIGEMVKSKLSYKYIMNCLKNNRLDKMLFTLQEEVREEAYRMVDVVKTQTQRALVAGTYKPLYELYDPEIEGSKGYFTQVCRTYWREHVIVEGLDSARRERLMFGDRIVSTKVAFVEPAVGQGRPLPFGSVG